MRGFRRRSDPRDAVSKAVGPARGVPGRASWVAWSSGLATRDHAAYRKSEDEQRDKTVDQERLSRWSRDRRYDHANGNTSTAVIP